MPEYNDPQRQRGVGLWLLALAALVVVQVGLGGVTRLTDSGLSITEWRPILGVIPPLDDGGWQEAFAKYRELPQFRVLRPRMSLEEFKVIYFWEWLHRLFGRLLGLAFVAPLVVFHLKRRLAGLYPRLGALLLLGGAQGVMGWIMVASGLSERVYVSHLRLAAHLLLAALLFALLVQWGLELTRWPRAGAAPSAPSGRRALDALLALLFVQLGYGALMAGLKAAVFAPTWPTINGLWVPPSFGGLEGLIDHPISVHFVHRSLAYTLVVGVLALVVVARRALGAAGVVAGSLVLAQAALGALTALFAFRPGWLLPLGVTHQLVAFLLLASLLVARRRLAQPEPAPAAPSEGEGQPRRERRGPSASQARPLLDPRAAANKHSTA